MVERLHFLWSPADEKCLMRCCLIAWCSPSFLPSDPRFIFIQCTFLSNNVCLLECPEHTGRTPQTLPPSRLSGKLLSPEKLLLSSRTHTGWARAVASSHVPAEGLKVWWASARWNLMQRDITFWLIKFKNKLLKLAVGSGCKLARKWGDVSDICCYFWLLYQIKVCCFSECFLLVFLVNMGGSQRSLSWCRTVALKWGPFFTPRGHLAKSRDIFDGHIWLIWLRLCVILVSRDAAKHLTVDRTVSRTPSHTEGVSGPRCQ